LPSEIEEAAFAGDPYSTTPFATPLQQFLVDTPASSQACTTVPFKVLRVSPTLDGAVGEELCEFDCDAGQ